VQETENQAQRPLELASTCRGSRHRLTRQARALTACGLLVLTAAGCSRALEQQVIVYPDAAKLTERPAGSCALKLESSDQTVRAGCTAIGDVFVGDNGQSLVACDLPDVLWVARKTLCDLGATHAHYRRISDTAVTCSQIRAVGFHCPSQGDAPK
jgi:hypothetical protein